MATIVSWPLEETIISLVIHELPGAGVRAQGWQAVSERVSPSRRLPSPTCQCQFVNLRMRTLSTSPKPASVAIIDDPP